MLWFFYQQFTLPLHPAPWCQYDLSTDNARHELENVLWSLQSNGHRGSKAWLDQNGSRCWREENDLLRNDVIFWDKESNRLLLQFGYRKFCKGNWKIQLFFKDQWQESSDYWVPYFEMNTSNDQIQL